MATIALALFFSAATRGTRVYRVVYFFPQLLSVAIIAVGVLWLVVAGLIAVVIRMQVPNPAELLRDVADQRAVWIAFHALLLLVPLVGVVL